MSSELLTWVAVLAGGGGGSIITFVTFWMAIASKIEHVRGRAELAADRAAAADITAGASLAKIELMTREQTENAIHAASRISALEAMYEAASRSSTQSEQRIAKSIDGLGTNLDAIEKRLGDIEVNIAGIKASVAK